MVMRAKSYASLESVLSIKGCQIYYGDNVLALDNLAENSIQLIYIDPPFNTGKEQKYTKIRASRSENGSVTGYNGQRYHTEKISEYSYHDKFDDYISFLETRIRKSYRLLKPNGSFFLHVDYREVHYCKVMMDAIFGRENFMNEIIWSYDYGARSKRKWSPKHDTILWYAVDRNDYLFNYDAVERIPYMAPSLVGAEKAQQGKTPTDVWWNSIVGTNSYERAAGGGYPTQKPLKILERIILVHSNETDTVLDFFAGSGTTGVAALKHNRKAILVDSNKAAIAAMRRRIEIGQ